MSDWTTADPASEGFVADLNDRIGFGVRSGLIRGLHSLVIARRGRLAMEYYARGIDESWGQSLGEVTHGPDTLHDLRSVTKSIVSLLYGIALARGAVPPPEATLLDQFPEHASLLGQEPQRRQLTVEHVLTMTMGTEWNEDIPYSDPANSEIQMERAPDRLGFILSRPMVEAPGTRWVYNGGTSALLGELIRRGTGQRLDEFARSSLFEPLGISRFEWAAGADGSLSAASGLRLTARDLARIGQLLLESGRADGTQVVPEDWLRRSVTPRVQTGDGLQYGYQWWLGNAPVRALGGEERPWFGGFGNGGQRLFVMPATDLVMVGYFGNYNHPMNWIHPSRVWWEIILPGLERVD